MPLKFHCCCYHCLKILKFVKRGISQVARLRRRRRRRDNAPASSTASHNQLNKLTSVFYASVLLLIMNFVITLSK